MNLRSRTQEPSTLHSITLTICLIGLCAAAALTYANGTPLPTIIAALSPPAAPAQATPARWPCPLPIAEGQKSVAILKKRGAVFDVTCRDIHPLIPLTAPKGAQ
jgi:hypothetical protein